MIRAVVATVYLIMMVNLWIERSISLYFLKQTQIQEMPILNAEHNHLRTKNKICRHIMNEIAP